MKDKSMFTEAYASGVLKPEVHGRLVADLDHFARDAAIPKSAVWTSLLNVCDADEIDYAQKVRAYRAQGFMGFVMTGEAAEVATRFSALAGYMVRNFIRARVMTVTQLVEQDGATQFSAVFVPNFLVGAGKTVLPDWKIAALMEAVQARHLAGQQTFLYASDLKAVEVFYGAAFRDLLATNYKIIAAG